MRVTAPARHGLANEAVRRALSQGLERPPSAVRPIRGAAARYKAFAVEGIDHDEAIAPLAAAAT